MRVRAPEHARVEHAGQLDVPRVSGRAGHALDGVNLRRRMTDCLEQGQRRRDRCGGGPARPADGRLDVPVVVATTAQVARQRRSRLLRSRGGRGSTQRGRAHHLPRRAEPALRRIVLHERLLQRVRPSVGRETLDGLDRSAIGPRGELAARVHRLAVHENGARAAFAAIASDFGAGQPEVIAEQFGERPSIFDIEAPGRAVDRRVNRRPGNRRVGLQPRRVPRRGLGIERRDDSCRDGKRRGGCLQKVASRDVGRIVGRASSRGHRVTRKMPKS